MLEEKNAMGIIKDIKDEKMRNYASSTCELIGFIYNAKISKKTKRKILKMIKKHEATTYEYIRALAEYENLAAYAKYLASRSRRIL